MKSFLLLALVAAVTAMESFQKSFLLEWDADASGFALLNELGLDDYYAYADHLEVFASADEVEAMQARGIKPRVLERSMPLYEKFPNSTSRTRSYDAQDPPPGYLNLAQVRGFLENIAAAFPNIAELVDTSVYGPPTVQGRYINMIKISDNAAVDEDEPNVIVVAAHHCRELVTPEIVMDIIVRLVTGYGTDPVLTQIVDNNQIYLVPNVNVDGYNYVFEVDDFWRKNLKNGYGVDINRNYDLGWDGPAGGSTDPNSNTHRGDFPLSESESTFLINFERERNIAKIIDFHSSGREVLPAFRSAPIAPQVHEYNWDVGTELSVLANYATRIPSADGEHQQQGIKEITTFGWLVETHNQFQPPYESALEEVARVWPLALRFLEYEIPLRGRVLSSTGIPLQATVSIAGIMGPGEVHTRQSEPRFGSFHLFLPDGTYAVTFSASGHIPESRLVSLVTGFPQQIDVVLLLA